MLETVISGGQTGVDRAALDAAMFHGLQHGGWCPRKRLAEDGSIPLQYQLRESHSEDYAVRTEQNVMEADGTLILYYSDLSGGTRLTSQLCSRHRKPRMQVDLSEPCQPLDVAEWIRNNSIRCLNVAGPRESSVPGVNRLAEEFLVQVFQFFADESELSTA